MWFLFTKTTVDNFTRGTVRNSEAACVSVFPEFRTSSTKTTTLFLISVSVYIAVIATQLVAQLCLDVFSGLIVSRQPQEKLSAQGLLVEVEDYVGRYPKRNLFTVPVPRITAPVLRKLFQFQFSKANRHHAQRKNSRRVR